MKKICFLMAAILLLTALCLPLSSCGVSFETYKNASDYLIANGTVSVEEIDTLEIHWIAGEVSIERSEDGKISFCESFKNDPALEVSEDMKMRYLMKDGVLTLQFCKSGLKLSKDLYDHLKKGLTVYVPEGVKLDAVTVDVVSSDLTVKDISAKDMKLNAVSAKLDMSSCAVENVDCKTVSGKVKIETETEMKSLSVDSVSGDVALTAPALDELTVKCVSADFELNDCRIKRIDCETVSGKIKVKTNDDLPKMKVDTVSGSVRVEAPSVSDLSLKSISADTELILGKADFTVSVSGSSDNVKVSGVAYEKKNDKTLVFGSGVGKVAFDSTTGRLTVEVKE